MYILLYNSNIIVNFFKLHQTAISAGCHEDLCVSRDDSFSQMKLLKINQIDYQDSKKVPF